MEKPKKIRELPNFLLPENSVLKKHLKWLNIVSWITTFLILICAFSIVVMYMIEIHYDKDFHLAYYFGLMTLQFLSLVIQDRTLVACYAIKLELIRRGHKEDIYG